MRSGISFGLNTRHLYKVKKYSYKYYTSSIILALPDVHQFHVYFSDVFALVTSAEIRKLRQEQPENLATLCYKATERLVKAVDTSCRTATEQQTVLNCVRLLTRVVPYIFEDSEWRDFFWSALPSSNEKDESTPLAQSLLNAICVRSNFFSIDYDLLIKKNLLGSFVLP